MSRAKWRGQGLHHREGGRDCRKAKPSGESVTQGVHLLPHGAGITDDAARPFEHALAFRGKALETGPAVDQQNAKSFLELLHACRQCRLRHPAGFGRAAKMLLPSQGEQKFQFFQQVVA